MVNIGRDARNAIISRREEREEIEAYGPSSNYRIPTNGPGPFKKCKHVHADFQGKPDDQHHVDAPI